MALVTLWASASSAQTKAGKDQAQIQHVLQTYVQSVSAADLALASRVWLHSPDVVIVTPQGLFQGWDSVRENLYVNFLQKGFLERDFEVSNIQIHVNGNTAWAVFDWTFKAKRVNGQPFASQGRETDLYYKTSHDWRMVHMHYSEKVTRP